MASNKGGSSYVARRGSGIGTRTDSSDGKERM